MKMAVLNAAQLNKIAHDVNTTRVDNIGDSLYEAILHTAMNGQFSYERTFDEPSRSLINRVILRMEDMLQGIVITHDPAEFGKLVFCWEVVDDMPPLVPFYTPYYEVE